MPPSIKIDASEDLAKVLKEFTARAQKLPADLKQQTGGQGGFPGGGFRSVFPAPVSQPGISASQEAARRRREEPRALERAYRGYQTGEAKGAEIGGVASELAGGGFAGFLRKPLEYGGQASQAMRERREQNRRRQQEERQQRLQLRQMSMMRRMQTGAAPGTPIPAVGGGGVRTVRQPGRWQRQRGAAAGTATGPTSFGRVIVQNMTLAPGASRALGVAFARSMRTVGGMGGGLFGRRGFGGGPRGGDGGGGFGLGALGRTMPYIGAAFGLVSMLSQRYQQVMQEQDQTIDALSSMQLIESTDPRTGQPIFSQKRVGGYVGGGGNLILNAQLAQARLARGLITGERTTTGLEGDYDIRFARRMGMGGPESARLAAQIFRFGGGVNLGGTRGVDVRTRDNMQRLLQDAILAGYEGLRGGEFVRKIAQITQQAYEQGFGRVNIREAAQVLGGLRGAGIRPERGFALYQQMQGQFQQPGGIMQNLAVAAGMGRGQTYMQARVGAERGVTRANLAGVRGMLGLEQMDPETRALIESQLFGFTATETMRARGKGGILGAAARGPGGGRLARAEVKGREAAESLERVGAQWIKNINTLNNEMSKQSEAHKVAAEAVILFAKSLKTAQPIIDWFSGGLSLMIKKIQKWID